MRIQYATRLNSHPVPRSIRKAESGFTVVELLITLFVAAAFLMAGYQLFSVVISDGGDARAESRAGNVAYDYLRRYSDSATNPCSPLAPLLDQPISVDGLSSATMTIAITCTQPDTPSLSRVEATIRYNNPQKSVTHTTYVDKSKGATSGPIDVTDGLVARWPFNGNANTDIGVANGAPSGGVTSIANRSGEPNRAYGFNGVDGYINVPYVSSLAMGSSFTISAWINPTSLTARQGVFSTRVTNATGSMQIDVGPGNGGTNRIGVSGGGIWVFDSVNNAISAGTWQHIAYVMPSAGSSAGVMYVNGVAIGTSSVANNYGMSNNTDPRRIGQGTSGTQPFVGGIDDVRLYNRALSGSEVLQVYNRGPQ